MTYKRYVIFVMTDDGSAPDPELIEEAIEAIPNHKISDSYWEEG